MCGRTTITVSENIIEDRLGAYFEEEKHPDFFLPNYNVTPTTLQPALLNTDSDTIHLLRWGLIPPWAKDRKTGYRMINARVETVDKKAAFKQALVRRRCLIPMDGYYEWKTTSQGKQPYRIVTKDQQVFTCAGLWEVWQDPTSGATLHTYTILTLDANAALAPIHHRMPAIMNKEVELLWLDNDLSKEDLLQLIKPYPSDAIEAYPVSKAVGNVKNNDASLIERQDGYSYQGSLF